MNFAAARNAPIDPKSGRKENVIMSGTVTSVDPAITFTPGKGAKKYSIELRDGGNEVCKVTIYPGTSPMLEPFHVNQFLEFNLSASQSKKGDWYYGGFWQCLNPQENQVPPPQQAQPTQAPPQQPQQAPPPQAAPPQNVQQGEPQRNMTYAYEVTPEVAARITRSVALEAASRCFIGKPDTKAIDVLNMAVTFWNWLDNGNMVVPQPGTDREPGEDDVPFDNTPQATQ